MTDHKEELWDAYTRDLRRIDNVVLTRGEDLPSGVYHLVSDVLVRHNDGTWLLMQRDPRKTHGGLWEATAGGSALRGETPLECAKRELREETGLSVDRISCVGRVINEENHAIYTEFVCTTDASKDSVRLQDGETVAYRWVPTSDLIRMSRKELLTKRMWYFISSVRVPF